MVERVLGLDYGRRRIGVALSDGTGLMAHPLSVIDADRAPAAIAELVAEHGVRLVVVGLPVSLSGEEGEIAAEARAFAERVAEATGVEVVLHNEQFTTVEAERVLLEAGARRSKRKAVRDKVAATVMLQGYLDSTR